MGWELLHLTQFDVFPEVIPRSMLAKVSMPWKRSSVLYFTYVPCILILSKFFIHQLMHKWVVLKTILKFTLKQLRHVSVQSHHHQGAHYWCLLKLQLLKQSIKIYWCVVMWLHILVGPCWCVYVVLSTSKQCSIHTHTHTHTPTRTH